MTTLPHPSPRQRSWGRFFFLSRWLQAPLYLGLIVAQAVYVYFFLTELYHLVVGAGHLGEKQVMMIILGLIDVVMIANLLIMVIIGGYETFVSRLYLEDHPDQPEWLSHVNAGVLKVKLATALIGISSINLLETFINLGSPEAGVPSVTGNAVFWQIMVHLTFVASAILLAWTDRITTRTAMESHTASSVHKE